MRTLRTPTDPGVELQRAVQDLALAVSAACRGLQVSPAAADLWRLVVEGAAVPGNAAEVAARHPAGARAVERELAAIGLPSVRTLLLGARTSYLVRLLRAGHSVSRAANQLGARHVSIFSRSITTASGYPPKALATMFSAEAWNHTYIRDHLTHLAPLWATFLRGS